MNEIETPEIDPATADYLRSAIASVECDVADTWVMSLLAALVAEHGGRLREQWQLNVKARTAVDALGTDVGTDFVVSLANDVDVYAITLHSDTRWTGRPWLGTIQTVGLYGLPFRSVVHLDGITAWASAMRVLIDSLLVAQVTFDETTTVEYAGDHIWQVKVPDGVASTRSMTDAIALAIQ